MGQNEVTTVVSIGVVSEHFLAAELTHQIVTVEADVA
jgi:hypothetical protein